MISFRQLAGIAASATLGLALAFSPSFAHAREAAKSKATPAANPQQAITTAAEQLFNAIAHEDVETVKSLTVPKYAKHLTKADLRPSPTGPKLQIIEGTGYGSGVGFEKEVKTKHQRPPGHELENAFDGQVKIVRQSADDAVVEATMFKPVSSDIPIREASQLKIYMVNQKGKWLASAPNKKEAMGDATMDGGWYHTGSFTFCPNKGLVFVGNHFSNKLNCVETAVCR